MEEVNLKEILDLRKKIGKTDFPKLVYDSCGHEIIPIDTTNSEDNQLIRHITFSLNNFLKITKKSGSRFYGNRINEVGQQIETLIIEEIRKSPLEVKKLGSSGYPDFEIKQGNRITYLELKTTGNIKKKETHHRMFYFSTGKKISSEARHLLLQIQMEEESNKYWKVVSWQLRDLSKLKVNLKTEFNANFQDFDRIPLLDSGSPES